jgi:alpha-galactosidase
MTLRRRDFCLSSAAAFALPLRGAGNRVLKANDFLSAPTHIHAFTENETIELKRAGAYWTSGSVSVQTETALDSLPVRVSSPDKSLLRVRLHWSGSLPQDALFLGDAWERSYGDLGWRPQEPERIFPWFFLCGKPTALLGCGVKTNPGAFCFWQLDTTGVTLWLDVRNGGGAVQLGKRTLLAATIVAQDLKDHSAFQATRAFCSHMADRGIVMPHPLYGGNNWYYAYGNSSADDIRADTERVASWAPSGKNRPFMVIDDGWSPNHTTGPWRGNSRFPDMPALAGEMLKMQVRPGLWFRPLTTADPLPENLQLKSKFSEALWHRQKMHTLDPTVPEAAEQIRTDTRNLSSWGYQLLKHDFSTFDLFGRWGFQMAAEITDAGWHFADRSKTNAEIVRSFYSLLREAAGSTHLLGCNTVGHLAAGLFEIQRTGDDTSGRDWSRTRKMGVNTLAFRGAQHRSFFDVDADCAGITKAIPWSLNKQWLDLLARSGTALFVSAAPDAVGPEQQAALKDAFLLASQPQSVAEPLDWLETNEPQRWHLQGKDASFDWFTDDLSLPL